MEETEKELRTIETFDGQSMTIEELLKKLNVKPNEVTIHFKNGTLVSYTKKSEQEMSAGQLFKQILVKLAEKKLDEFKK